jgi:hypothetical protein
MPQLIAGVLAGVLAGQLNTADVRERVRDAAAALAQYARSSACPRCAAARGAQCAHAAGDPADT